MRKSEPDMASLGVFVAKFLVGIFVLVGIWWKYGLPVYGWLLGKICTFGAGTLLGVNISGSELQTKGLFNTESLLTFHIGEHHPGMPIALLVTNLPPFIALVLATSGLTLVHRLKILGYGCSILVAGHIVYICTLLRFQERLQAHPQIPVAVTQVFLTLPFLLWIVLAYWDHIAALMGDPSERKK